MGSAQCCSFLSGRPEEDSAAVASIRPVPSTELTAAAHGDTGDLKPNSLCFIKGLSGDVQLNGKPAICRALDTSTRRWQVLLPTGQEKLVKASNLILAQDVLFPNALVYLRGVSDAMWLASALAEVVDLKADQGMPTCVVQLPDGQRRTLQLENMVPLSVILQPGTRVYLRGLQAARNLNWGLGTCDQISGQRWVVEMDDGVSRPKVDPKNILPTQIALQEGVTVYLYGLSATELNGSLGTLRRVDTSGEEARWVVDVKGKEKALKVANLVPTSVALCHGTVVYIRGLDKARDLNGKIGLCHTAMITDSGRWRVKLGDGGDGERNVRADNLVPQAMVLQPNAPVHVRARQDGMEIKVKARCIGPDTNASADSGLYRVRLDLDGMEESVPIERVIPRGPEYDPD